jgi:hypothetical protein
VRLSLLALLNASCHSVLPYIDCHGYRPSPITGPTAFHSRSAHSASSISCAGLRRVQPPVAPPTVRPAEARLPSRPAEGCSGYQRPPSRGRCRRLRGRGSAGTRGAQFPTDAIGESYWGASLRHERSEPCSKLSRSVSGSGSSANP